VIVDEVMIMPNHIHGIVVVGNEPPVPDHRGSENPGAKNVSPLQQGANNVSPLQQETTFRSPAKTVGSIVRGLKIGVTKWFRSQTGVGSVWQRNYYEHVIRDEHSLDRIRQYIQENPVRWEFDRENPNQETDPLRP
jgi:putative transposase